jgi:hypothetical protein
MYSGYVEPYQKWWGFLLLAKIRGKLGVKFTEEQKKESNQIGWIPF